MTVAAGPDRHPGGRVPGEAALMRAWTVPWPGAQISQFRSTAVGHAKQQPAAQSRGYMRVHHRLIGHTL